MVVYLVAMLAFGWWGKSRTKNNSDFLVAGRRLGPFLYTGTMAAVVLGGASTVGGVGLGYKFGISGMWLVVAIGAGVLLLSLLFASTIQKLKIYTVSQMLTLRYGSESTQASGIVMLAYTLMLCATSTGAYATIFVVLFGWDRALAIAVGGAIVLVYSTIGGMWSITLADQVQFVIKTVGIFMLMLPFTLNAAGGLDGIRCRVDASFFQIDGIGVQTIITYFVVYTLGLLIGQDIWQRVFTAKTPTVARWGGATAGIYCILYGVAGALIGLGARVALPDIDVANLGKDVVYAEVATEPAADRHRRTRARRGRRRHDVHRLRRPDRRRHGGPRRRAALRGRLVRQDRQHRRFGQPRARRQGQPHVGHGPGHRRHRAGHHHQGRRGRPDHRLRHPGRRPARRHPRRARLEARHRRGRRRLHGASVPWSPSAP